MIEIKKIISSSTQFAKQMSLTNNPDYFWDSGYNSVVSSNHLASSSDPRLVVLFESTRLME